MKISEIITIVLLLAVIAAVIFVGVKNEETKIAVNNYATALSSTAKLVTDAVGKFEESTQRLSELAGNLDATNQQLASTISRSLGTATDLAKTNRRLKESLDSANQYLRQLEAANSGAGDKKQ
jgi:cell shape-determining protein MreC